MRTPYLHLHGELACSDAEVDAVREGLRKAGGAWASKAHQVHTCVRNPDTGWVSYCFKADTGHALRQVCANLSGATLPSSWRDNRFFMSQGLRKATMLTYAELRPMLSVRTRRISRPKFKASGRASSP